MVNFVNTETFLLHNNSNTNFYVAVKLEIIDEKLNEDTKEKLLKFFMINFKEGFLPAKS